MKHCIAALSALIFMILACGQAAAQMDQGLTAYWRLDGNGRDSGPLSLDGQVTGAVPAQGVSGVPGTALSFDGSEDVVEVPQHPLMDPPALTVTAWIRPERSSQWARIVGKYDHASELGWNLHLVSNNYVAFEFWNQAGEYGYVQTVTRLTPGEWHFLAVTWDGQRLRIYQDGQLENESPAPGPINPSPEPLTLGSGFDGYNYWPFTGIIDEVRLFARALDQGEIQFLSAHPVQDPSQPDDPAPQDPAGCSCPDSDHDGVPDAWDGCPGTPPGALTDAQGCPH